MKKLVVLGFIMGMVYYTAEGFWRGWTNISMLFVGGLCCLLVGFIDDFSKQYKIKLWIKCILGTLTILLVEFISGVILNIWLKLNIWDYSDKWGNVKGQICITNAGLWFILTPVAIWLYSFLKWKIYGEGKPYKINHIYLELIKLK